MKPLTFLCAIALASPISAQSFSCNMGGQPSCLNYGETVCSSQGMCVSDSAACFDKNQCGYDGFTCKSNVTECIQAHDDLLRKHNELVDDFNENLEIAKKMAKQLDDMEACITYATTIEDAKQCAR